LSLVLVMAASLLLGTFRTLATLDPGFRREGVLLVSADMAKLGLDVDPLRGVQSEILARLRALPGVRSASASYLTPIGRMAWNERISTEGFAATRLEDSTPYINAVSDGYFTTLQTVLIAGRDFDGRDGPHSARVAAINEAMALHFFKDARPLGR